MAVIRHRNVQAFTHSHLPHMHATGYTKMVTIINTIQGFKGFFIVILSHIFYFGDMALIWELPMPKAGRAGENAPWSTEQSSHQ